MNKVLVFILSSTIFLGLQACSKDGPRDSHDHGKSNTETYYTCSMHPQIKEKKPGKCPICHMNLTKIER